MAAQRKTEGKAGKDGARKAQGGLAKPVKPDATLAPIVGSEPITRAALTKKVWDYVKKHDLQDPEDRRTIRADDKLRPVFGGQEKVSMFEMTKLVNQHVSST
ncbi:MAG: SWIB/MDM2 domain-containing protein [Gemmatimonadota bacterium]